YSNPFETWLSYFRVVSKKWRDL
ncbi:uncharacterized protein METZ01_LOCUS398465, partial [marine metagenome]